MILLTGAAGKTGQAIIKALKKRTVKVRAFVRTSEQALLSTTLGAKDTVIGDLRDKTSLERAISGCESIYYICPNITPDEVQIGKDLLTVARNFGIKRIVYHSVLHPHIETMPHHWQKMRMEECLFESGIDFTILQPCAYMQNILSSWNTIIDKGIYAVPYSTAARLSIVDLEDVAEVAAVVLTEKNHSNTIYELAGPQPLTQDEVARLLSISLQVNIIAAKIDRKDWAKNAKTNHLSDYQIDTLLKMFEYYENFGLVGNSNILEKLICRKATTFADFIERQKQTDL
jgi:NAD(P)H dehydrogenase (quinone)